MVAAIKRQRGDPLIGMNKVQAPDSCIKYLCDPTYMTDGEKKKRRKEEQPGCGVGTAAAVEEERAKLQAAERKAATAVEEERAKRQVAERVATLAQVALEQAETVPPPRFEVRQSQQTDPRVPSPLSPPNENCDKRGVFATVEVTDVISDDHMNTEALMYYGTRDAL